MFFVKDFKWFQNFTRTEEPKEEIRNCVFGHKMKMLKGTLVHFELIDFLFTFQMRSFFGNLFFLITKNVKRISLFFKHNPLVFNLSPL